MKQLRSLFATIALAVVTASWGFPQYHLTLPPVIDGVQTDFRTQGSGYTVCQSLDGLRNWRFAPDGSVIEIPHADMSIDYPDMGVLGIDRHGDLYGIARTRAAGYKYVPFRWSPTAGYQYNYENPLGVASDFYVGAVNSNGFVAGGTQQEGYATSSVMWDETGAINQDMSDIIVSSLRDNGDAVGVGGGYRAMLRRFGARSSIVLPWSHYEVSNSQYGANCISSSG